MRHESVARIESPARRLWFQVPEFVLVRLDEGELVGCDVFSSGRSAATAASRVRRCAAALRRRSGASLGQSGRRRPPDRARNCAAAARKTRGSGPRDAAFAVEDFASRRQDRHIAHPVLLRQQRVFAALHDLQLPQSVRQQRKKKQHDVLHGGQPERGDSFFGGRTLSSSSESSVLNPQFPPAA